MTMESEGAFQKGLKEIENDVVAMGGIVEKAIERAVEALKKRDLALSHKVIADDAKINQQRFNIEDKCIRLVAAQRPTVRAFVRHGLAVTVPSTHDPVELGQLVARRARRLSADAAQRQQMRTRGPALIDGRGAARVARAFKRLAEARHA